MINFFWSGQHWLRSAALYPPVDEGGQGVVDIASRLMAFRMITAKRLLYSVGPQWLDTASVLLRKAGRLGYDKHLFLIQPNLLDLGGLTFFYRSVMDAWSGFIFQRTEVVAPGMWLFEEPLFGNPLISSPVLSSASLKSRLVEASCVKVGNLLKTPFNQLARTLGIRLVSDC